MAQRYGHWKTLGIDPTHDERSIKRAYAVKLKAINVGADPQAFIALRSAFEGAREASKWIEPPESFNASGESVNQNQSLAEDDLNPKIRVLRYAPQGKLEDKKPQAPRPKIRVKPAGALDDGAQQEQAAPKTRIKPKKPDAVSDTADFERENEERAKVRMKPADAANVETELDHDNAERPKIRFKPDPKTPQIDYDIEEQEGSEAQLQELPVWYHAPEDGQTIDDIIDHIYALLNDDQSTPVDEGALEAVFQELLAAPELENIGQREAIETRIASMALNAQERGFFLVLLAHWNFGWHKRAQDYDLVWPIDEVVSLAPAIIRSRALQTGGRDISSADVHSYRWLLQGPPPRWNPLYWTRRAQIIKFVDRARAETPALLDMIGYDRIAAWQSGQITGSRLITLLAVLAYATWQWTAEFASATNPDFPLPIWLVGLGFAGVISVTFLLSEYTALAREKDDPYFEQSELHDKTAFLALAALGLQSLIFGLLPPRLWLVLLSVPVAMLLLFFTRNPLLRLPSRDRSFVIARRMTIGAFFIITMPTAQLGPLVYQQVAVPAAFFLWAAARMHETVQAWFDERRLVQRWMLHLILLVAAASILYSLHIIAPNLNSPPPYWYIYAAMLIVVFHDLVTPRDAEIPGSKFLILPILTLAMTVLYPIPIMMAVVILRTVPVLYAAYSGRRHANASGRQWRDHGGGYSSNTTFGEFSIFGKSSRNDDGSRSIWFWIGMIFVALQVIRLLINLDKTTTTKPIFTPPPVSSGVLEEYTKEHPLIDPKTGKISPEFQKILDENRSVKRDKALPDLSGPPIENPAPPPPSARPEQPTPTSAPQRP